MRTLLTAAWITGLLAITCPAYSQLISVDFEHQPLGTILDSLKHAGNCWFNGGNMDVNFDSCSLHVRNATLYQTLKELFTGLPITFRIDSQLQVHYGIYYVNIKDTDRWTLRGKVIDVAGEPQQGLRVSLWHMDHDTLTDSQGDFELAKAWERATLKVGGENVPDTSFPVSSRYMDITVRTRAGYLPKVIVNSYFRTGLQQPDAVNNPGSYYNLDGLSVHRAISTDFLPQLPGQIPGLLADPAINNPLGLAFHGRNTLYASNAPYFILDGFVYFGNWGDINPNDIESATMLRDAVAAGIWGPFSANGVMVVTSRSPTYKDSFRISFTMNYTVTGKPNLYYVPQLSPASYIGMEKQQFQLGNYDAALSNPEYPAVSPVVYLLSQERSGLISASMANAQMNYLGSFDTRHELLSYFYQTSINQQYHFSIANGGPRQHYYLSAGYDHDPTDLVRDKDQRYTLHGNYSYQVIPHKLEINALIQFAATGTLNNNPGDLPVAYPYGPLADDHNHPLPIAYKYNPGYIDTAGGGRLLDWYYRPLQELGLANNSTHHYAGFVQLKIDYHVSQTVAISLNYRYSQSIANTTDLYDQNSFYVRDLQNQFSEPSGPNMVYPVPLGDIRHHSDTSSRADNLRIQATWSIPVRKGHRWIAMAGAELDDLAISGQDQLLYGYDPRSGNSIPVDLAGFYPDYITGDMQQIPGAAAPLGLYNRYVSVFSNLTYTIRDKYSFYGALRKDATNIVGTETNNRWSPFWSLGAGWEITRNRAHPSKLLPLLKWRLSYGCNGNVGDRIAYLQTQDLGLNLYGSPQSGITSPPNPELSWEKTYVLNTGFDFALLQDKLSRQGRIRGSIDGYLKWSDHLLGNDTLPPSAGLADFFGNSAAMRGGGVDLVLDWDNIRGNFQWTSRLLLSWAVDRVSRYLLQPQYPSAYVSGSYPRVGESSTALFAYRWAGLDPTNGNPRGYLNGQPSTDYLSIMNGANTGMRVRGSYQPLVFGSLLNTFHWKNWSLSAMLLFKGDYWFRRSSINYSLLLSGQYPGDKDYDQRWMVAGDEKRTMIPSLPAISDPNRDLFYQQSDVLVTRGDQLRWQDLRIDYTFSRKTRARQKACWRQAVVYAYLSNLGILWRANREKIDPDASGFGSWPAIRTYSLGIQINI